MSADQQLVRQARPPQDDLVIPLPNAGEGGPSPGWRPGFAVDESTDSAWLATGLTLYRVDLVDHHLASWAVPPPPRSQAKDSSSVANARSGQQVVALRLEPSGDVLLQITSSASLVRFKPSSKQFSEIPLPDIGEASDVAVAADGTIAVGMSNYVSHHADTVILLSSTGTRSVGDVESLMVVAVPDGFVVSGIGVYFVSFGGVTSKVPIGQTPANGALRGQSLSDGRVAIPTQGGPLQLVDPSGKRPLESLSLGRFSCGGKTAGVGQVGSDGASRPPASATATMCPAIPEVIAVSQGDLFVYISPFGLLYAPKGTF